MDLLLGLAARGCPHLVLAVLSLLSSRDLASCALVCRGWAALLQLVVWSSPVVRRRLVTCTRQGHCSTHRQELDTGAHLPPYSPIYAPNGECNTWSWSLLLEESAPKIVCIALFWF